MEILGYFIPKIAFLFGAFSGLVIGLLGVGLVLVFRSSRFINFAHGDVGAFGAAMMGLLVLKHDVPYLLALAIGIVVAAALSALIEVAIVRKLAGAPKLMSMVATVGMGQFLFLISLAVAASATGGGLFPRPPGLPTFRFDNNEVGTPYVAMLIAAPLALLALVVFFRRSRYGLAIRGAAANSEAAAMAGMSPKRLTTMTWAIAGALSCLTAALLLPTMGAVGNQSLGPQLLLRALAAAVIGRMHNLWLTFVAGIAIGIGDRVFVAASAGGGASNVAMFVVILGALLLQAKPGRREQEKGSWAAVQPWPPLPEAIGELRVVRYLGLAVGAGCVILAAAAPLVLNSAQTRTALVLLAFTLVGLSVYVVTGLLGQLSLGQFGVAAAGAVLALAAIDATGSYELGLVAGALGGIVVAVLVGLPALRVQGLLLAVATLGFAVAVTSWALKKEPPFGFGTSTTVGTPTILGIELRSAEALWWFGLVAAALIFLVVRNLRLGSWGRVLVALRDNEDAARAFSIGATWRKVQCYAVSGALAGLGGTLYAYSRVSLAADDFPATLSTTIVVIAVVGGAGAIGGSVLGAGIALPAIVILEPGWYAALTLGWIVLIVYVPNGVTGLLRPVRDVVIDALARMSGVDVAAARASADPARAEAATAAPAARLSARPAAEEPASAGAPLVTVRDVRKRYGGLLAVGGVDLEIRRGEVLGLIGPNGAGKTTLFECLSGFVKVDAGTITYDGHDITGWSPQRRARAGLIRSFQDAALFPTMTVLETVLVSIERSTPSRLSADLLGLRGAERRREQRARELVALLGLDRYRHLPVGALSTGTRRIAEIACLVALEPTLLLLDEPSSGIAQREVEALGDVLLAIRRDLDATLVVIEHDIPLVTALSDRMVAMETGCVLAVGTPDEVLNDPRVVESYLGGDPAAVQRSGTARPVPAPTPAQIGATA